MYIFDGFNDILQQVPVIRDFGHLPFNIRQIIFDIAQLFFHAFQDLNQFFIITVTHFSLRSSASVCGIISSGFLFFITTFVNITILGT